MTGFYRDLSDRLRVETRVSALTGSRLPNWLILALAVAAMAFPLIALRGYHYEEGLTIALAKAALESALEGGRWWVPDLFGQRWIERPVMQSWIVAAFSWPFGGPGQITARLPSVLALFACALMVTSLLRPRVSRMAALAGGFSMLLAPAVLQKVVTAESDVLLTAFQFAAFLVWWKGVKRGGPGLARWALVGLLLAVTAGFKGPQPAAYFALGIGAFILVRRDWRQVPGYVLAGAISLGLLACWYLSVAEPGDRQMLLDYMRLHRDITVWQYLAERLDFAATLVQFLPATLLAAPAVAAWLMRREPADIAPADRTLFLALLLYGGVALLVLAPWPGAETRYAMPALPALATIGGLAFDRLRDRALQVVRWALILLAALATYQLVAGWIVAPLNADAIARTRLDAHAIDAAIGEPLDPVVAPLRLADPILAYLDRPVRYLLPNELEGLDAPAWLLADEGIVRDLAAARPDLTAVRRATMQGRPVQLYEVAKK